MSCAIWLLTDSRYVKDALTLETLVGEGISTMGRQLRRYDRALTTDMSELLVQRSTRGTDSRPSADSPKPLVSRQRARLVEQRELPGTMRN